MFRPVNNGFKPEHSLLGTTLIVIINWWLAKIKIQMQLRLPTQVELSD